MSSGSPWPLILGEAPEVGDFRDSIAGNKDKDLCLKADTEDPTWIVGEDRGVADVVVWGGAAQGQILPHPRRAEELPRRGDDGPAVLRLQAARGRPVPQLLGPARRGAKADRAGLQDPQQRPVAHNIVWSGTPVLNRGENVLIPPRKEEKPSERVATVYTGRTGREELVRINCNLHL